MSRVVFVQYVSDKKAALAVMQDDQSKIEIAIYPEADTTGLLCYYHTTLQELDAIGLEGTDSLVNGLALRVVALPIGQVKETLSKSPRFKIIKSN